MSTGTNITTKPGLRLVKRLIKWLGIPALIVVVGLTWAASHRAWVIMHVAPIVLNFQHPIGPPRHITWEKGPAIASEPPDKRPPNIIFILADDLGWNGVTMNGRGIEHGAVPTPNIDSIAHNGVDFINGYAANATCAPSRAALMTGRYATRFGFEYTPTPNAMVPAVYQLLQKNPHFLRKPILLLPPGQFDPPFGDLGLPTSQITIAQELKKVGYHTVEIGKWHLGEYGKYEPTHRGFDESLQLAGLLHEDKDAPDVVNAPPASWNPIDEFLWAIGGAAVRFDGGPRFDPKQYLTRYFTDQAIHVIHNNRNRPFFIYLAYWAVHGPLQAPRSDYDALPQIKDHTERVYGAMIRSLDHNVGRVLQALKDNGLLNNTLVVFTSDNGAPGYEGMPDVNRPFRGWKMTYFEGGLHVPFYMQWPARIQPGTVYHDPVQGVDIFSTIAGAAHAPIPTDRKMDGVNLLPYVSGEVKGPPHHTLYWQDGGYKVLIENGWKLQVMKVAKVPEKIWLFDLTTDPTEQHNLADSKPKLVASMTQTLMRISKQQVPSLWKSAVALPVEIDKTSADKQSPHDQYVYWTN